MNNKEFFDSLAKEWDKREVKSNDFFYEFVSKYFHLKEHMKVLDLACGTGVISEIIYNITKDDVLGLDLSDEMIRIAKSKYNNPHIKFISGDFYSYQHAKFDAIVCHNAYPHFLDKEGFKNKAYSLLRDHGLLVIAHSISKEKVNDIHKTKSQIVCAKLASPSIEAKVYLDKFKIIDEVDEDVYLLVLEKL